MEMMKIWGNLKCILLNERSQSEKATYSVYNYMTFWKRQKYGDSKKKKYKIQKSVVARVCRNWQGRGGMNRKRTKDFYGSENTLHDTIMMDTCH